MVLGDLKLYGVSGIDCLIWEKQIAYGFLGRLREKGREGILTDIFGQLSKRI
jgi:hypothetical protein